MPLEISGRFAPVRPPPYYTLVNEDTPPPALPDDPGIIRLIPEDLRSVELLRANDSTLISLRTDPELLRDEFLDVVDAYLAEMVLAFDSLYMLGDISNKRNTQISQLKARLLARRDDLCAMIDKLRILQAITNTEQALTGIIEQKRQTIHLLREQRRRILEEMPERSFEDKELPSRFCPNEGQFISSKHPSPSP
ncbi:hypothetical protein GL50803_003755 [Giardia duodenalis]|uniref:Uncharacterized protein n=1 Tax=Giardia intestinalis (strain ATCC 50803 / WB clone C6) TaxID=184922 RepID=A8BP11_GIAIC|nr:hypothetical protein GL50803_003755 [Giardia intestinalis]KAE8304643.1 hypothetical protein GL50803_003755 [Giardia intestinalis]|eukprot:XP_001705838.1 Hypothetical protein GL50803_3755 [Giardia lamblia ATCC 50803]